METRVTSRRIAANSKWSSETTIATKTVTTEATEETTVIIKVETDKEETKDTKGGAPQHSLQKANSK